MREGLQRSWEVLTQVVMWMQARTEVEANAVKLEGDDSERSRLVVALTKVPHFTLSLP